MKKTIVSSLLVLLMLSMTACSNTVIESDSSGDRDGRDNWEIICAQDSEDMPESARKTLQMSTY